MKNKTEGKMEIGVLAMYHDRKDNPFQPVADMGLKTAQLQNWDMTLPTPDFAKKVRKDLKSSGIRLAAFWGGYSGRIVWNSCLGPGTCGLVPRDLRERRVAELKKGAEFAEMIGAPALVTHCGFIPENPMDPLYAETLNAVYDVASHCLKLGIGFWFEAGQETPLTLLRTIEDLGLPNLGVNLDTANLILYGRGNPADALDILGKYVRNLHIKDGLPPVNGRVLGTEVPVGEGKADFDAIIRKLYELKFTGELTIEREISGEKQIEDIRKAEKLLRKLLKKYAPV